MKANSLQQVAILLLLSAAFPVKVYCLDASSQWQSTIEAGNKTESSGKFDEAEKSYRSAISMAEKFPQPDIRLALSLNNLAMLCVSRAKNDQAESLYKRAISILNKVSSPPEVLPYKMKCLSGCLGGLGAVYAQQAKYELAISTFKQAIELSKKNPSETGIATVSAMINLSYVYQKRKQFAESTPILQTALSLIEKSPGTREDKDLMRLKLLNNLANNWIVEGKYSEAESTINKAIAIMQARGTLTHPDMGELYKTLGTVYYMQGKLEPAKEWSLRAFEIEEATLGTDNPKVASSMNNFAVLLMNKKDYEGAEALLRRAIAILEKSLGLSHPDLSQPMSNLVLLLKTTNREVEAVELEQRLTEIKITGQPSKTKESSR